MAAQISKTPKNVRNISTKPTHDEKTSLCREKLTQLVREKGCFYEIFPDKFYLVYLARGEEAVAFCDHANDANCPFIFWSVYDSPGMSYEAFNMDFGPFNLATTHQFCSKLKVWFDTQPYRDHDKYVTIVVDDFNVKTKLNVTLLVAIAAMVLLNLSAKDVIMRLNCPIAPRSLGKRSKDISSRSLKDFTDVSGNPSVMRLTLEDCILGFYAALQHKFYEYYEFDHAEYLFYETVMSGDLNWIVPNKILAFAGPCDNISNNKPNNYKHPPRFYHDYFKDHNVTTIIRLNESEYDKSEFENFGFEHYDLIFPDGYPPTSPIAERFIKIVNEARGAVAVHCYAGIGRTGTLIAAYLMARYNITAQMAVAWTRICRPGSVIGDQQDWLLVKFNRYSPLFKPRIKSVKSKKLDCSTDDGPITKTNYEVAERSLGQAKALMLAKKNREKTDSKPCTRNSTQQRNSSEGLTSSSIPTKRADLVLDLGKTVPFSLSPADLADLQDSENPKFYRMKDNKYEWTVKFPVTGYVALKHDREYDIEQGLDLTDRTLKEPKLRFVYKREESTNETKKDGLTEVPKMKPLVCYSLTWYHAFALD